MITLKPPCMIVVQYVLPALRVAIAKELIEKYGMRKTDVAEKMDVTPAAVTQYVNASRGDIAYQAIERSEKVTELISDLAKELAQGRSPPDMLLIRLCRACQAVRTEGLICDMHKEAMPSLKGVESCACSLGLAGWSDEERNANRSSGD